MDDFPKEMPCPCGDVMTYRLTRKRKDGGLSHEFRCRNNGRKEKPCNRRSTYRWEDGEMTKLKSGVRARLTDEQARAIVTSELSAYRLADKLGLSPSTVKDVRTGRIYAAVTADLRDAAPQRKQNYCNECIHYDKGCTLGFPEARNGSYASVCSVFQEDDGKWRPTPESFLYLDFKHETATAA